MIKGLTKYPSVVFSGLLCKLEETSYSRFNLKGSNDEIWNVFKGAVCELMAKQQRHFWRTSPSSGKNG